MYGADPYASVPYATLGGSGILVAACIHVTSQLVYNLDVASASVYQVLASAEPVYCLTLETYVC